MLVALYVAIIIAIFIPYSLLLRYILRRSGIEDIIKEIRELSEKASKLSPKDKKLRMIKSRYEFLRRRVRYAFLLNLFVMWLAIFTAITVANAVVFHVSSTYGIENVFTSPLRIPGITLGKDQLNIFLLVLAVIVAYQPLHNKISLMSTIYGT
jgi:hypothetical protein